MLGHVVVQDGNIEYLTGFDHHRVDQRAMTGVTLIRRMMRFSVISTLR